MLRTFLLKNLHCLSSCFCDCYRSILCWIIYWYSFYYFTNSSSAHNPFSINTLLSFWYGASVSTINFSIGMISKMSLECFNDSEKYIFRCYNLFNDLVISFDPPYECNITIGLCFYLYYCFYTYVLLFSFCLVFYFFKNFSNSPYARTQCIVTERLSSMAIWNCF